MHEWDHPQILEFLTPPPPPHRGRWTPQGREHVGRHCPCANKICCGSVHALFRYRSKTAKMQKFPIDSHCNENFISLLFRPPGAANPQKGRRHIRNHSTPACKLWRESACGLSRNRWPNKKNKCVSKTDTNPPFAFQIAFPQGTDFTGFLQRGSKIRDLQSEISVRIESQIESADSRLQLQC